MDAQQMEQLSQDVADIKRALLGNEAYSEQGLVKRVTALEKWRAWLTLRIAIVTGGVVALIWIVERVWK